MKKPIYKRVWFWVVIALLLIGAGERAANGKPEESPAPSAEVRALPEATPTPTAKPSPSPTVQPTPMSTPKPTEAPTETPETIHGIPADTIVYVSEKSNTIHKVPDCSGMKNYREMTIAKADGLGFDYCPHCW